MISNFKKNFMILLIWLILSIIILAISSILALFSIVDVSDKSIYVFICGIISFLILGFLSGNIKHNKGLLNGIIFSFFVLIIFALLYFLGYDSEFTLNILAKYAVFILSGGLGGIFGVNFKPIVK